MSGVAPGQARPLTFAAMAALCAATALADSLVTPVATTAESYFTARPPINAINGSGMSGNPVIARSAANNNASLMWLSNGTTDTWIMFDMGEKMVLSGMHVWNYNESYPDNKGRITSKYHQRGVKTCELRVGDSLLDNGASYADAGEWGTLKDTLSFACATGAATGYEGEDVRFGVPINTRYVMLRVTANHGLDAYTGLSEVRFYRSDIGIPVSPVAATAQSHFKGGGADDRKASNTIDGSDMSPSSPPQTIGVAASTTITSPAMWLSNGNADTWIAFDLGEEKTVTGFHLWNYNEAGVNMSGRGIKTADVYVSDEMPPENGPYAAWGRLVETMEFAQAPGVAGYLGEDYRFQSPVTGRYFQFVVKECFLAGHPYIGISEILFYEKADETTVTRLSSGAKTIPDGTVVAVVSDGEGEAAPIAVADGTRVRAIRAEASGGRPQIALNGGTLAVGTIDLPAGAAGLEIMQGNIAPIAEMRRWLEWRLGSDLVMHANLADEAGGTVNLYKTGPGTLVFDGTDTRKGDSRFSGGVFRQTGGSLDISGGTFVDAKAEFLGGTSRATGTDGFALCGGSSMTVADDHSAEWSMLQAVSGVTALAVRDGATLKLGSLTGGAPDSFKIDIDGGTIGPSALRASVPWLQALGPIRVGEGGAVFDTSDRDAIVDAAIEGEAGGAITKIGANTLELRHRVANAGPVHIKEGTLKLALPQAVVRYDFEGIFGTKVPNRGSGGAAYDGVISGAPEQVAGTNGTALSFCAATNGVATENALPLRDYTYATWVKSAGLLAPGGMRIIAGGSFGTGNFIGYLGTGDNPSRYWAFVRDIDANTSWISNVSVLSGDGTESWHHLASTYDGTTVTLYYDGNLVSSYPASYVRQLYNVRISFGNNLNPNSEFWNGAMDDACVFDRALSADEIAMLARGEWKAVNVLNPESDLSIDAGAKLDLGGTDQTVATLTLKGRLRRLGPTTWGAIGSGADHETDLIVGDGVLRVTGPARGSLSVILR